MVSMTPPIEQEPAFGGFDINKDDILENSDPRCPTILVLDISGSMAGTPINELQEGVGQYLEELNADPLAKRRVEIAIVTFGGKVTLECAFATADRIEKPILNAGGDTPMGEALVMALDTLKERKMTLNQNGVPQYRAWVFLITDGGPTDERLPVWKEAIQRIKDGENRKSFLFFAVGVMHADMNKLKELCVERPPVSLKGLEFRKLFQWLSASQKAVSSSQPGANVVLPSPESWTAISV
jgi:uncharacterized protein YegL